MFYLGNLESVKPDYSIPNRDRLQSYIDWEKRRLDNVYHYLLQKGMSPNDIKAYIWRFSIGIPMTNPGVEINKEIEESWLRNYTFKKSENKLSDVLDLIDYIKSTDSKSEKEKSISKMIARGHSADSARKLYDFMQKRKNIKK